MNTLSATLFVFLHSLSLSLSLLAHNEGFVPETLAHGASKMLPIKKCTTSDPIISRNHALKAVTATTKVYVDRYVHLKFADGCVRTGCEQQFYTDRALWKCAQDLCTGDALCDIQGNHHLVLDVKIIHESVTLYALSVEDNVLCIEPYGLLVHNMAAVLGASSLSLGAISIANPIALMVGATVALSIVASRAWQTWQKYNASHDTEPSDDVILAERLYYETRKKELEQLKNELIRIKEAIETIKLVCKTVSFTYQFFKQAPPTIKPIQHRLLSISKDKERKLNAAQQQELRTLRQQDLLVREQEIIELHTLLAMHSNTLIERMQTEYAEYQACNAPLHTTFNDFACGYLDNTTIGNFYACLIMQELALERMMQTIQEACCVAQCYQKLPSGSCIHSSTTIVQAWHQAQPCIANRKQLITKERDTCNQRMRAVEQHFTRRGGDISKLKNGLRTTTEKHLNKHDIKQMTTAITKLNTVMHNATGTATLPEQIEVEKEEEKKQSKTVEDILADAELLEVKDAKIFGKKGGYAEALADFESLNLSGVKDMPNGKIGKIGELPDGRRVNVRIDSSDKRPTLEIQPPRGASGKIIKVRYGTK